ncbi:uncharacterized protein LOC119107013 [Pollicipes pollicipes]|uniref:uncharacterized protein LOC119107013 n=1 Tax=Pollicipes pollicipes TaxID=41117 RepID=UPI0018851420|nr:uncharacterized protein LOC119107013 [Pollicipes pollicipes]
MVSTLGGVVFQMSSTPLLSLAKISSPWNPTAPGPQPPAPPAGTATPTVAGHAMSLPDTPTNGLAKEDHLKLAGDTGSVTSEVSGRSSVGATPSAEAATLGSIRAPCFRPAVSKKRLLRGNVPLQWR